MNTIRANWYEYPEYYDIAFGWDPGVEVEFLEQSFQRFAVEPVRRVYEPFCGTGRIAIALAQRGYEVTGADILPTVIEYARKRADEQGAAVEWCAADVCGFCPSQPVDAVVSLIDSFRHLAPKAAHAAVERFSAALRPGGLLILGVDVGEKPVEMSEEEHWAMQRDGVSIETAVFDLRKPGQTPGTSVVRAQMHITEPDGRELEIICDDEMTLYTLPELLALLQSAGGFEPLMICDRRYDLQRPINPAGYAGDIVAVFLRQAAGATRTSRDA
ncbi:MAG: class I SAM-dependent methyltransferase [Planctomycetota bacterium]|nr:MAG: class I SAM-dependent methyltransferase [Planctomycetota bacterium]